MCVGCILPTSYALIGESVLSILNKVLNFNLCVQAQAEAEAIALRLSHSAERQVADLRAELASANHNAAEEAANLRAAVKVAEAKVETLNPKP
jgi:hypothetical protein